MKFSTYNQQAGLAPVNAPALQVSSDPNAYGGSGAGLQAMARGISALAAGIEQHNENEDKLTYTEAMNELDKRRNAIMFDGDNAYMKRILKDSAGSSAQYEEEMRKATEDVAKQFGFKTSAYKMAFMNSAQRSNMEGYKLVNKREYEQGEAYKDVLDKESVDNKIKGIINGGYMSNGYMENALEDEYLRIDRRFDNESAEVRDLRKKSVANSMVGSALSQAITDKNFKLARDYVSRYGKLLSPENIAKYNKQIDSQESAAMSYDYAQKMVDSDMTYAQAVEFVKTLSKRASYTERDMPMQDIEDKGLAGTNKNLVSAAKQLNGWVFQSFGQDMQVSGGKRSEKHNKEVNGSPTSYHLSGNALDINLSMFNAEQRKQIIGKAREMGFNSDGEDMYHDRGSGEHLHLTLPSGEVKGGSRLLGRDEQEEILKEYTRLTARKERIESEQVKALSERWDMQYRSLRDDPNGVEKGQAILRANMNLPPKQFHALESIIGHYTGSKGSTGKGGGYGKAPSGVEVAGIIDALKSGRFKDRNPDDATNSVVDNPTIERNNFNQYVAEVYGNNPAAKLKMDEIFKDYTQGKGAFSYDDKNLVKDVLDGTNLKGVDRTMAERNVLAYAASFVNANTTPDGIKPSYPQIVQACRDARGDTVKFSYKPEGGSWYTPDKDIVIDKTEQIEVAQADDGHFDVTVKDEWGNPRTKHMTGEELQSYRGKAK